MSILPGRYTLQSCPGPLVLQLAGVKHSCEMSESHLLRLHSPARRPHLVESWAVSAVKGADSAPAAPAKVEGVLVGQALVAGSYIEMGCVGTQKADWPVSIAWCISSTTRSSSVQPMRLGEVSTAV